MTDTHQTPSQTQWKSAQANANNTPSNPGTVKCAPIPRIAVNWRQHDFQRVKKGDPPPVYDLVITSTGTAPLTSINVRKTSGDQFEIVNPGAYAKTLQPGASTTVQVRFKATAYEPQTGGIDVTSNASNEWRIPVSVKGKIYSVITFVVEEETGGAKVENVKLTVQQKGQEEQEVITKADGTAELETEHEGNFEIKMGEHEVQLEFRSLASA